RHGHRDLRRGPRERVPRLPTGRQLADPPLRRHRPRPRDLQEAREGPGRGDRARQRGRSRLDVHARASSEARCAMKARKNPPAATTSPLVLVVDDFDDNRSMYVEYLQFHGFRVAEATDGEQAVARAKEVLPDVIVMDLS